MSDCPVALIAKLRKWTDLSVSEIRRRVAAGEVLWEFEPFQNDWREIRHKLVAVAKEIVAGNLPVSASIFHAGNELAISIEVLQNKIEHYRQIELETQCDTMLELGEIDDPSQFTPYDEDWTRSLRQ